MLLRRCMAFLAALVLSVLAFGCLFFVLIWPLFEGLWSRVSSWQIAIIILLFGVFSGIAWRLFRVAFRWSSLRFCFSKFKELTFRKAFFKLVGAAVTAGCV